MAPPSSHRPRKKRAGASSPAIGTTIIDSSTKRESPAFPLAAFFWPAKGHPVSQWVILPCILMIAFLFRWATSLWGYSGLQNPPMHGDFEAQRHWMELTTNLPVTHWYFHDLQWWGLDYPPLTAYHSWILGFIGAAINPEWFALYRSRGLDALDLKIFMRATVVVSEYLIYVPAAVQIVRRLAKHQSINPWDFSIAVAAILLQPATILIDHGHFQYNTVMNGFVLASMASMVAGRPLWSCVYFVAALGFKQMALFFAPAVAAYLAGICFFPKVKPLRLVGIAIITVLSFVVLFLPLVLGTAFDTHRNIKLPSSAVLPPLLSTLPVEVSPNAFYYPYLVQLVQAIHRIFPFARGLFEDKVANVWCAIHSSGLHKLNNYPSDLLSKAALALTLTSIMPPCLLIFFKPRKELIPLAFATTAWGFFMCSYQVHEKNVLLPLLPMTVLLATDTGMKPSTRAWVGFANVLACWTLFPLLVRDELRVPYFVLTFLWAYLMGLPPTSLDIYLTPANQGGPALFTKIVHLPIYLAMIAWHVVEAFVLPPTNKPDLWVVANVCLGAAGFGMCYLWCLWRLVEESGILGNARKTTDAVKKTQ
ncbi:glycosyltransferase family 57 protein [Acrodontium crateriforme]|uniref:Alpha-1,3-glucosyltransferase n=1 Tax=Acrodontium crateriforme TaxID=150365 RepID=A0AAQ3M4R1_9PEZI|nr:glycosyltransferase family 57 protein [Acrodontium crateriforme]